MLVWNVWLGAWSLHFFNPQLGLEPLTWDAVVWGGGLSVSASRVSRQPLKGSPVHRSDGGASGTH